jgi:hypothetical protein
VALTGDGKVGQEGDGFAPVKSDRYAIALDVRRAEQTESKAAGNSTGTMRHQNTSFISSVLEITRKVNRILPSQLYRNVYRHNPATVPGYTMDSSKLKSRCRKKLKWERSVESS